MMFMNREGVDGCTQPICVAAMLSFLTLYVPYPDILGV